MVTAKSTKSSHEKPPQKTKIDRAGKRILERVERQVDGELNSSLDFRKKFYSPRRDIVDALLKYVTKITERFPGVPSSTRKYKRYPSEADVLVDVEYEELTRVGYSGHFAMKLLRDEFPTDFFVLESTELGPRLVCKKVADPKFLAECGKARRFFDETPRIFESSVRKLVEAYVASCRECDDIVFKVCELCS